VDRADLVGEREAAPRGGGVGGADGDRRLEEDVAVLDQAEAAGGQVDVDLDADPAQLDPVGGHPAGRPGGTARQQDLDPAGPVVDDEQRERRAQLGGGREAAGDVAVGTVEHVEVVVAADHEVVGGGLGDGGGRR